MSNRTGSKGFGKLEEGLRQASDWYLWGPYVSERQWGTVREDYSADGEAWDYLPHDLARSQAYRWGEDGLAGFCDVEQRLCLGLALWNGRDPILKERAYGLTGAEANHGEDVKEYWWYLDAVPSHAWNRWRYHYPQGAFPYQNLRDENGRRGKTGPGIRTARYRRVRRRPLLDRRGPLRQGRPPRHSHVDPDHQCRAGGRHPACAAHRLVSQHLVVGCRSRQTGAGRRRSRRRSPFTIRSSANSSSWPVPSRVAASRHCCSATTKPTTVGSTACRPAPRTPRMASTTTWSPARATVNPEQRGTKCAAWYRPTVAPGATVELRLRLRREGASTETGQRPREPTSTR